MQLIFQSSDRHDIEKFKMLLESRGIPVHVGNEETNRNLSYMSLAVKLGLWVVFDDQYDDAIKLMANESHEVSNPRNIEEVYAAINEQDALFPSISFDKVMLVLVVLIIFMLIFYYGSKM